MTVVVTGANGLVGSALCAALSERGALVRAVVRRSGTAPVLPGVAEHVGDFADPDVAAEVLAGADAAVTTVHPMGSDEAAQRRVGVEATVDFARAAAHAGVQRLVHVSTAAVYDRAPGRGDVDEQSALVADDAGDYPVTKRDADLALESFGALESIGALESDGALESVGALTRVLLRPPAILGAGESSIWNSVRPAAMRDDPVARHAVAQQSFAWVHVDDLAAFAADIATGRVATCGDPATGPVAGRCTAVNVVAGTVAMGDYVEAVTRALGVTPVWDDGDAWTGRVLAERARGWGWRPAIGFDQAMAELDAGLR